MERDYLNDQDVATEPAEAASAYGTIDRLADSEEGELPRPKRPRLSSSDESDDEEANLQGTQSIAVEDGEPIEDEDHIHGVPLDDLLKIPENKRTAPGQGYVEGDEGSGVVIDEDDEEDDEGPSEQADPNAPARIHRGGVGGAPAFEAAVAAAKTDNTGADKSYLAKESKAEEFERRGEVYYRVVENDGTDESMYLLTGLKNVFQRQLPKMPREYIARLVFDRNHRAMACIRKPNIVIGGTTFRPFPGRGFAEIVFLAVESHEQVNGFGRRVMSYTKDHVVVEYDVKYLLTYADNYATGYFRKQGFTNEITLDRAVWMGYIKDYEGGTIMQVSLNPFFLDKFKYTKAAEIVKAQRKAVFEKIKRLSKAHIVHDGLQDFKQGATKIDPAQIPGLIEAGWTPDMEAQNKRKQMKARGPLHRLMRHMMEDMKAYKDAWPFLEPVSGVPDYYEIIKEPMDLRTMETKMEEGAYTELDSFTKDMNLIFSNCKTYNADGTSYWKCAVKCEKYFKERLKEVKLEQGIE
ncbi:histone acetyltransferase [Rhizophlyctis rosea]|nr:histone acetyltransferase [Rhizophlyctis rosea]